MLDPSKDAAMESTRSRSADERSTYRTRVRPPRERRVRNWEWEAVVESPVLKAVLA
jgi:hypothetical protein